MAQDAQDIDFLLIVALGFPPAYGGILAWGDKYGLKRAVSRLGELGRLLRITAPFEPSALLVATANAGRKLRPDIAVAELPRGVASVSSWVPARPGVAEAAVVSLLAVAARAAFTFVQGRL